MAASQWQGKTALVCGASAGLGRVVAKQLAQEGIGCLGILARNEPNLAEFRAELLAKYPSLQVVVLAFDLTQAAQVEPLVKRLTQELPTLHLVVNAVGKSDRGTIDSLTADTLDELYAANVYSSLHALQAVRASVAAGRGCIVLIGSLASFFAPRFLGGYALAKHSVAALAQQARLELESDGVHVMLACPGPIRRGDAGTRYDDKANDAPAEALKPGGGVKLSGLDPDKLGQDILSAAARRKSVMIRPKSAWFLVCLNAIWPTLAEWVLKKKTS